MTTLAERWMQEGMEKGMEKAVRALHEGIEDGLHAKFGEAGLALAPVVREIRDVDRLRNLLKDLWTTPDLDAFAERVGGDG